MSNITKISIFAVALAMSVTGFSQQESHFTQFMYNKLLLNPAFASARDVPTLTGIYRNQWLGFEGAPKSMLLSFDSPFFSKRVGFGLSIANETKGTLNRTFARMAYSYSIIRTEDVAVRIGINGSLHVIQNKPSSAGFIRDPNDPSLLAVNKTTGNVGAGVYFDYKNFYIGASVPSILKNVIGVNTFGSSTAVETPHVYVMSGILIPLTESIVLRPSVIAKFVKNTPFDLDANLSVMFNQRLSVGGSYRLGDSADLTAFLQISKNLGLGLGYDFTLSELSKYNSGSIEVLLRYDFGTGKDGGKGDSKDVNDLTNPRFFF